MSDDLVKRIKDRGDWLVDAVATATQNRMFLRGEPECDDVACDAIRMNGEKAMSQIAKPLADRIEALEAKLAKAEAGLLAIAKRDEQMIWGEDYEVEEAFKDMRDIALATLADIQGESHD